MPLIVCAQEDLISGSNCTKKGLKVGYRANFSDIDWPATLASVTQFTVATQTISGFTMLNSATWSKIGFKRKGSFYTQSYTSDTDVYTTQVTANFEGKGVTLRNALTSAIKCCDQVIYVIDSNGRGRLFGVDWDGIAFNIAVEGFKITQHDDNSGDSGGDDASDVVIFGGESENAAIYGDIDQATFESTYL